MSKTVYAALAKVFAIVLVVVGAAAIYGGNFAHGYVTDQLKQEKISMPTADGIAALESTDAQAALKPYIGQQLTTGEQAKVFANDYIWQHMMASSQGKTYEEVSGEYIAATKAGTMSEDELTKLGQLRQTMFMGDSLRGMLLNAYGWWLLGTIAIYAGIGAIVVGVILAVLGWGVLRTKKAAKDAVAGAKAAVA